MGYKVDNAIILAAGTASRFAPLSYEKPKALIEVKGEVLIERQIRQLHDAGIDKIYIVVGYKKEHFDYLREKFGVIIINNPEYLSRNNNSSIFMVKDVLKNSYICSSDNYFSKNPFEKYVDESFYSALYSSGETNEWCITTDENGYISKVTIGGRDSWYMLGHVFWSEDFTKKFLDVLEKEYYLEETRDKLWEHIFIDHLNEMSMKKREYSEGDIFEFDTLDELRLFDESYINDTRSEIIKSICGKLFCNECDVKNIKAIKDESNEASGFAFEVLGIKYKFNYKSQIIQKEL